MDKLFKRLVFIEKEYEAEDTITFKFKIPQGFSWDEGTYRHVAFGDFIKVRLKQ